MADITTMSGPQAIAGLSRQLSSAIARAEEAERRVADLEGELGRLRDRLADRRWRTSDAEMPVDVVEIRATGWHTDGYWYIYVDDDLVCKKASMCNPYIQWRPL